MLRDSRADAHSIDAAAAQWAVRLDRGLSAAEQRELNEWLAQDTRCIGALARAQAGWVHADRARILKDALPPPRHPRRPALLRWSGVAAALLIAGVSTKSWLDFSAAHPVTAIGEVRAVPLEDGSRITLDTDSRVAVQYKSQTRLLTLERGVAVFDVSHDPQRPFVVQAGHTRVRAVGTSFLVRRSAAGEEVIVIQGTVDVWRDLDSPEPSIRLSAGHRSLASSTEVSAPRQLSQADMARATAWESGIIELSGQTLGAAAAEFNRYNRQRIEVHPTLASETVVGRFQSTDPAAFAHAAAAMLSARVRADGNTLLLEPGSP